MPMVDANSPYAGQASMAVQRPGKRPGCQSPWKIETRARRIEQFVEMNGVAFCA